MSNIITFGLTDSENPHPVQDFFTEATNLFDKYGAISLTQVIKVSNMHYDTSEIDQAKEEGLHKYLYGLIDGDLQKYVAQITDKIHRRGLPALYYILHKVTKANSEAICRVEKKLHSIHLKDYKFNATKLVSEIRTLVKTI